MQQVNWKFVPEEQFVSKELALVQPPSSLLLVFFPLVCVVRLIEVNRPRSDDTGTAVRTPAAAVGILLQEVEPHSPGRHPRPLPARSASAPQPILYLPSLLFSLSL